MPNYLPLDYFRRRRLIQFRARVGPTHNLFVHGGSAHRRTRESLHNNHQPQQRQQLPFSFSFIFLHSLPAARTCLRLDLTALFTYAFCKNQLTLFQYLCTLLSYTLPRTG